MVEYQWRRDTTKSIPLETGYIVTESDCALLGNVNSYFFQTLHIFYGINQWNTEIQALKKKLETQILVTLSLLIIS